MTLLLALSATSLGATLTVPGQHATIGAAIRAASAGDTIEVAPGTYNETPTIDKALDIVSTGGAGQTTIQAPTLAFVANVVTIDDADVYLRGFTINGGGARRDIVIAGNPVVTLDHVIAVAGSPLDGNPGGAVLAFGGADLTIVDSQFDGNGLPQFSLNQTGAHVVVSNGGKLTSLRSSYVNGTAQDGGAIAVVDSDATIVESTFDGGQARGNGGAILATGSTVTVQRGLFEGNAAGSNGGAIAVGNTTLVVDGTTFDSNQSGGGGGHVSASDSTTTLSGGWYEAGDASGGGGAVRAVGGTLTVNGPTFLDNVAGADAGAIIAVNITSSITNSTFTTNTSAFWGGAVLVEDPSGNGFVSVIRDNVFEGNLASSGGAVAVNAMASDIVRNTFCNNTADTNQDGGAVAVKNAARGLFTNNLFLMNTSDDGTGAPDGGAIAAESGSSVVVLNNDFLENVANDDGSAVRIDGTNTTGDVRNNIFAYNGTGIAAEVDFGAVMNLDYDLFYMNTNDYGANTASLNAGTNLITATDPMLQDHVPGTCGNNFWLSFGSPAIDTGDTTITDPDGSRSDIGAYGGPSADPAAWVDSDNDGAVLMWDCDDADATVGNPQLLYPDADGDGEGDATSPQIAVCDPTGYVANNTDCDDTDPSSTAARDWYPDGDGDGYGDPNGTATTVCVPASGLVDNNTDCDDTDAAVWANQDWYADADGDGFGNPSSSLNACNQPTGYVADDTDCNDGDRTINPNTVWYEDVDGDSYGDASSTTTGCTQPNGYVADDTDCDDSDASINPGTTWYRDRDGDGYGDTSTSQTACVQPGGFVDNDTDCDDGDINVNPATLWYEDADGDSFGTVTSTTAQCLQPNGYVSDNTDCDDTDSTVNPNTVWYDDSDSDGYGDPNQTSQACIAPRGTVSDNTDCNDANASVYPGAIEVCDSLDNDCNGTPDDNTSNADWYLDSDGDGVGAGAATNQCAPPSNQHVLVNGDCDDSNAAVSPNEFETCDNLDNDCNNLIDDDPINGALYYDDIDGDGFGDLATEINACAAGSNQVTDSTDCDDMDDTVYPGAAEVCDQVDNDCDGLVDDNPTTLLDYYDDADDDGYGDPASTPVQACDPISGKVANDQDCDDTDPDLNPDTRWYVDGDGDGYGDPENTVKSCEPPTDGIQDSGDCDDNDNDIYPGAEDIAFNGVDENCDGEDNVEGEEEPDTDPDDDKATLEKGGCGCDAAPTRSAGWVILLALAALRRRDG